MATRYVPEQYPDFTTALGAASSGDTIVLNTSSAMPLVDVYSALANITVEAGEGKTPVLDHTLAATVGLTIDGTQWTFTGVRFRSTVAGSGGYAINADGQTAHTFTQCVWEGSPGCIAGDWGGVVQSCEFRHITGSVSTSNETCVFRSCTFVRCDAQRLIQASDTTCDNCTLIQCRVTNSIFNVDQVRNCTAQACTANAGTGYIFRGVSACTKNNAYQCTALANFAGVTSGNTTVDPQHVDLATDFRLRPGSPLIGTGSATSQATEDFNLNPYLSPISVGAYESLREPDSTSFEDIYTLRFFAPGGQTYETIASTYAWTLWSVDNGVQNAVAAVSTFDPGGGKIPGEPVELTLYPGVSPGVDYLLTAESGTYGTAEATVTPDPALAYPDESEPYRNVAAVANAWGRQLAAQAGTAQTALVADLEADATTALVESTLGFADDGAVYIDGVRFTYTSKTDAAFHGLATEVPRIIAVNTGTPVVFDERSYIPNP
jgi:hypothetical protein